MNEIIHWNQQTEFTETKDVAQPLTLVGGELTTEGYQAGACYRWHGRYVGR